MSHERAAADDLARKAQQGDRDAFLALYQQYVEKVYNRVCSKVPQQYAEDVTQEVFIAVIRSLHTYQHRSRFNTWLYTLVNRQIADFYRRYQRGGHAGWVSLDADDAPLPDLASEPDDLDDRAIVRLAFDGLPEHYQDVILLRFADGLSFAEIAEQRAQSLEAVKSLYRRAVQALRESIDGADENA